MPREDLRKIRARDRHAASKIAGIRARHPEALILVLFTYGGWNEMAYVAAEVKDPHRNIPRALVLGTVAVTAIYVLATMAFVHALGFAGLCQTKAVAADGWSPASAFHRL